MTMPNKRIKLTRSSADVDITSPRSQLIRGASGRDRVYSRR
jgi:hypothetical protein